METFALFLLCGLILVSIIGSIWMLIAAVRVSILWFLAVIFIPGAFLVFAVRHWDVAKKPFLLSAGPGLVGIGAAILIPNLVADREQAAGSAPAIEEPAPAPRETASPPRETAPAPGRSEEFAERFLRGDASASCPPGATLSGARPPKGFALWCEQDGVKHGPYAAWHPNRRPATAGLYRYGRREGVWLRYSAKGGLEASASFRNDLQHGPMRKYDPFGRISHESHWVDGAPAS
jgi:hypothetical protein